METKRWTIEQLTASLKRSNINPDGYGERIGETHKEHVARILREAEKAVIAHIVEYDKLVNWPRIQAELNAKHSARV